MSKYNLLDIHEGKSFEDSQEKSREEKHPEKKTIDKIRALMAKEKKVDENEAVDLAIEASQAKAGIKEDEDEDRKNDEDYEEGWADDPRIDEVRIDRDVAERIEGLMNIQLKKQFLDVFEDLWLDLIEEDPFYAEDVIAHLSNEMSKQISNRQAQGDRLAGMEESDTYVDEIGEGAMQPGEADLEAGVTGNMDAYTEEMGEDKMAPSVEALFRKIRSGLKKSDKNFQRMEIDMYIDSLMRDLDRGDFDGVEQYSMEDHEEDLFNMVADKQLQEHFGRFMKKYQ